MSYLKDLYRVMRLVRGLLISHGSSRRGVIETVEHYPGLSGEKTPVKKFRSLDRTHHTLIIYPGASPLAEDHPGLTSVGNAMARAGFEVLIPRLPPLKELSLSEEGVEWIGHFYDWLLSEKNLSGNEVTLSGISFSGALLLKASLDNRLQSDSPRAILVYGTYFSMETYVQYLTTGERTVNDKKRNIQPDEWGLVVLFHNFLPRANVGYDTANVQKILQLRVKDLMDEVEKQTGRISGKERELVDDILNARPSPEIARISQLFMTRFKSEFEGLSPKVWCDKIATRVFIVHGAEDTMTPFTESTRLAHALQNSTLLITYAYEHGDLSEKVGVVTRLGEFARTMLFFFRFIRFTET